jgi:hypothetical protein
MLEDEVDPGLGALLAEVEERWRSWQGAPRKVLYQYTNAGTLTKILESKRLWATLSSELNDTTELEHANNILKRVLRKRAAAGSADPCPPLLADFQYPRPDLVTTFVACLSGAEDHLPQWCMYGGRFAGVALGFDSASLVALDRSNPQIGFFRVRYFEAEQEEFFEWLVTTWERDATAAWPRDLPAVPNVAEYKALWYSRLAIAALSVIPRMKSRHFEPEQEWRLVHLHNRGRAHCQVDSQGARPHVALDLGQLAGEVPLASIWLGPAVANDESEALVHELLSKHGRSDVIVERSEIPLRSAPQRIVL